jgi:hypothetical protein
MLPYPPAPTQQPELPTSRQASMDLNNCIALTNPKDSFNEKASSLVLRV